MKHNYKAWEQDEVNSNYDSIASVNHALYAKYI